MLETRGGDARRNGGTDAPLVAVTHRALRIAEVPCCLRCGFEVTPAPWGCKNPCRNCGFVYPLGDCSD